MDLHQHFESPIVPGEDMKWLRIKWPDTLKVLWATTALKTLLEHGITPVRDCGSGYGTSLKKAVELDADNVRYIYVYAIALNSAGEVKQALDVLHEAHLLYPSNTDNLTALATFNRDAGNDFAAQRYMKKLEKLR